MGPSALVTDGIMVSQLGRVNSDLATEPFLELRTNNDSSANYPLVQFRSLDNDLLYRLLPNPSFAFDSTSCASVPLAGFPFGHYPVAVLAHGIPSTFSRFTRFGPAHGPPAGTAAINLLLSD